MDHDGSELLPLHDPTSSFDIVLRGYDRSQVHEFLERMEADLRIAVADRDAAAARTAELATQLAVCHGELESMHNRLRQSETPSVDSISERLRHMLQLAEEEAASIRRDAQDESARMKARMEQLTSEIETRHGDAERRATTMVKEAQERASRMLNEARAERERLDAEAEAKRQQASQDFEIALRSRREEEARIDEERRNTAAKTAEQRMATATAEAEERIADATAEADRVLTEARTEAKRTVSHAQHRIEELNRVRDKILDQLGALRTLLDGVPRAAGMTPEERARSMHAGWQTDDTATPDRPAAGAATAVAAPDGAQPNGRDGARQADLPTKIEISGNGNSPKKTDAPKKGEPAKGASPSKDGNRKNQAPPSARQEPTPS